MTSDEDDSERRRLRSWFGQSRKGSNVHVTETAKYGALEASGRWTWPRAMGAPVSTSSGCTLWRKLARGAHALRGECAKHLRLEVTQRPAADLGREERVMVEDTGSHEFGDGQHGVLDVTCYIS